MLCEFGNINKIDLAASFVDGVDAHRSVIPGPIGMQIAAGCRRICGIRIKTADLKGLFFLQIVKEKTSAVIFLRVAVGQHPAFVG